MEISKANQNSKSLLFDLIRHGFKLEFFSIFLHIIVFPVFGTKTTAAIIGAAEVELVACVAAAGLPAISAIAIAVVRRVGTATFIELGIKKFALQFLGSCLPFFNVGWRIGPGI